jgi:hypothetical protein
MRFKTMEGDMESNVARDLCDSSVATNLETMIDERLLPGVVRFLGSPEGKAATLFITSIVKQCAPTSKKRRMNDFPDQKVSINNKIEHEDDQIRKLVSEVRALSREVMSLRGELYEMRDSSAGKQTISQNNVQKRSLRGAYDVRQAYPLDVDVWQFVKLLLNADEQGLQTADLVCCKKFGGWPARIKMNVRSPNISDEVILSYPDWRSPEAYESLHEMRYLLVEFFEAKSSEQFAWVKREDVEPFENLCKNDGHHHKPSTTSQRSSLSKAVRSAMSAAKKYHDQRVLEKTISIQQTVSDSEYGFSQVTGSKSLV